MIHLLYPIGFLLKRIMMSLFYKISILLLLCSVSCLGRSMTLVSDSLVFDDYLRRVDATGNVRLILDEATIVGDHLMFYVDDNMVISSGNVCYSNY